MIPIVSVVIATYQAGDYLRKSIESALNQSFKNIELVVSDDAGSPEVQNLLKTIGDSRVRYRTNPIRLGPASNHWAAFADCRGRYIAILNHDDLWHPEFLATLLAPLEMDSELALVFCDHEVIDSNGEMIVESTTKTSLQWGRTGLASGKHQPFRELVVQQTIPMAMGSIFRRSYVESSDLLEMGPAYDLWLAYLLARTGKAAWYIPARLSRWRVHPAQITHSRNLNWAIGALGCWQAMYADPGFVMWHDRIRRILTLNAIGAARAALDVGQIHLAREYSLVAVRNDPVNWRVWVVAAWVLPLSSWYSIFAIFRK